MARKRSRTTRPITSTRHRDKRANIPTEELRDFVAEEEESPEVVLYPRDPSLDPQLVWQGKDEQDGEDLAVAAVPIYIQEKVHPHAIVEDVWAQAKRERPAQLTLFDDFNGLEFEELIEFYRHEQNWTNRMILGDSLLVMTSLAEKEGLKGQVQMIYVDPPYGIKFGSNWQVSTRKRNVRDGKAEDVTRQPEQVKAFRDTWELGIHSYLAYLRDRLMVARGLLTESGSIFVQIGDENVHLVRCLMDEVFGSENFCAMITYRTSVPLTSAGLSGVTDYIVWYAKDKTLYKFHDLFVARVTGEKSRYSNVELPDGQRRTLTADEKFNLHLLPEQSRPYSDMDLASSGYTRSCTFDFEYRGRAYQTSSGKSWKTTRVGMERLAKAGRITDSGSTIRYVIFYDDFPVTKLSNSWQDTTGELDKRYIVQTHTKMVQRCLLMTTDPGDLVLDPTCGAPRGAI
jgi:adenine-specific DNA-methyltransferase